MEDYLFNISELSAADKPDAMLRQAEPFVDLMMRYNCAMRQVETKFEILSDEFNVRYKRNPVESIQTRLKKPMSIIDKMKRRGIDVTIENIEKYVTDVAGVRVICSYIDDIYALVEMFTSQDDIHLVETKDYIKDPKPNGYRSLHVIIETPIFLSDRKEVVKVEVQFRTIAMDFWASLEHKLKYKQTVGGEIVRAEDDVSPESEKLVSELRDCADQITALDYRMQDIRRRIENGYHDR